MLINWINVTVYAEQWPKLFVLLPQADRAINEMIDRDKLNEVDNKFPSQQIGMPGFSGTGPKPTVKSQREMVFSAKAKILAVYGLANLQSKEYKTAAEKFMQVCIIKYKNMLNRFGLLNQNI